MRFLFVTVALIAQALAFVPEANAIGDAGCGLGSLIFKQNKVMSQTLALTTNMSFYTQLFGITSGTSNCSRSGFAMADKEPVYFAEANLQRLSVEMAQGEGESLDGFAQVLGCGAGAIPEFKRMTKQNYPVLFPTENTSAQEMLESVKREMSRNLVLSSSCGVVG